MRYAGYDLIVIRGKAEKPVYLWINDEHVEIRDAAHIWGKDAWTTQTMIQDELGDPDIQTLKIGPSGENMGFSSCVISNLGRAAGRCSIGAVWGSKNLKAVAVRGNQGVSVAQPEEFMKLCNALIERAKGDPMYDIHTSYGTSAWVSYPSLDDHQKARGLTTPHPLRHDNLDSLYDKNLACFGCAYHCSHFYSVKSGKYKGTAGEGFEGYLQGLTNTLRITDPAFIAKYNNVCNQLGLHNVTPCVAIAWAMSLYEDGIITREDTDGLELTWGNEAAILELLPKIASKEGFGAILDDPIRGAEMLGRGSDKYIAHIKKNPSGVASGGLMDFRYGFAFSVATRGSDHLTGGQSITWAGRRKEVSDDHLRKLGKERYDDPEVFFRLDSPDPKKALDVYDTEAAYALCDMTGICHFASHQTFITEGIHPEDFARLMSTATGIDFSADELIKATERQFSLERSFNAREGIRRIDDYPHPFHHQLKYGEQHPRYDYSSFKFSIEDFDIVLDEYYRLRGCDLATGIPTRERLESDGLKDVAEDLTRRGILPP